MYVYAYMHVCVCDRIALGSVCVVSTYMRVCIRTCMKNMHACLNARFCARNRQNMHTVSMLAGVCLSCKAHARMHVIFL